MTCLLLKRHTLNRYILDPAIYVGCEFMDYRPYGGLEFTTSKIIQSLAKCIHWEIDIKSISITAQQGALNACPCQEALCLYVVKILSKLLSHQHTCWELIPAQASWLYVIQNININGLPSCSDHACNTRNVLYRLYGVRNQFKDEYIQRVWQVTRGAVEPGSCFKCDIRGCTK